MKDGFSKSIDHRVMEKVLGWKHGVALKGGGCRPVDSKPTPVVETGCYKGCEMGSRGGTYPFFFHGTIFMDKRMPGVHLKFSESLDDAMWAMDQAKMKFSTLYFAKSDKQYHAVVTRGKNSAPGAGKFPAEALCNAMLGLCR